MDLKRPPHVMICCLCSKDDSHSCRLLDQEEILYILTLGVAEGWRGLGIASTLIQSAVRYAAQRAARAVYLHVISYNVPAICLYARAGFREAAVLRKFYNIR